MTAKKHPERKLSSSRQKLERDTAACYDALTPKQLAEEESFVRLAEAGLAEIFAACDEAGFENFLQDRDQGEYEKREPL